jgi:plastocyanin
MGYVVLKTPAPGADNWGGRVSVPFAGQTHGFIGERAMSSTRMWLGVAAALATCAVAAEAGTVRGMVRVPAVGSSSPALDPYPGRASSLAGRQPSPRGLPQDAVIWIERVPADTDSMLRTEKRRPRLAQRDQAFAPRVLAVAAGNVVDFPNEDPIFHNVFSLSPVKRFDLGKYPRGQSRSVTFPKPGVVPVFCDIHSDMAAWIVVTPNGAYARPDGEGAFHIGPLPAGRYTVHGWHPDFARVVQDVNVTDSEEAALVVTFR